MPEQYPWKLEIVSNPVVLLTNGKASFTITLTNEGDAESSPCIMLAFPYQTTSQNAEAADVTRFADTLEAKYSDWPHRDSLPKASDISGEISVTNPEPAWVGELFKKKSGQQFTDERGAVKYVVYSSKTFPKGATLSFKIEDMYISPAAGEAVVAAAFGKDRWEFSNIETVLDSLPPQFFYFEKNATGKLTPKSSLLTWSVNTGAHPINAGDQGEFSFTASRGDKDVYLKRIAVTAEIGETPTSLTKDATSAKLTPPNGWKPGTKNEGELWAFVPSPTPYLLTKKDSPIKFKISNVNFSDKPGVVALTFSEDSSETKSGQYFGARSVVSKAIIKHAPEFIFAHFTPMRPAVQNGQTVKLSWDAQNVVRYNLYSSEGFEKTHPDFKAPVPPDWQVETPALERTTSFILEAFSDLEHSHRLATTIDVLGGDYASYDTIEVTGALNLNTTYHHVNPTPYNASHERNALRVLDEGKGPTAAGDRFALIGLAKDVEGDARGADLGLLGLKILVDGKTVATLMLNGSGSPVGLRLPAGQALAVEPNDAWKNNAADLTATLSLALTDPRIPPGLVP
ncbi:hypothetical protein [Streptomyces sp. NPDC055709]